MFLNKEEKILVLLYRIEIERWKVLLGNYKSPNNGQNKIRKLKNKIDKLGGNNEAIIKIE